MESNYTVVQLQRQHFGNDPNVFDGVEPNVPFVGAAKTFSFDCPGVNAGEAAFLSLQSRGVDHQKNVLQVNGIDVSGGLPGSPGPTPWHGNLLLIAPQHRLKATGNVLHVASRNPDGGTGGDIDDFIIDDVVIVYNVADVPGTTLPKSTGDLAHFVKTELLPSITNVKRSGDEADPADRNNEYVLPNASQLAAWRGVFQSLLAGSWGLAHVWANAISSTYNLVKFLDTPTGRTYFLLMEGFPGKIPKPAPHTSGVHICEREDPTRRGWGSFVFDPQPQRALSFSAPHPKDDSDTADEAVEAYVKSRARTLLIAGADRDQNTTKAPCAQSKSRTCFESDMAHNAETVFQVAFEHIYASDSITWHLQFHGNKDRCATDVFLSNGVPAAPALLHALAANIKAKSKDALTVDVFDDAEDCDLRGTDNMQMRFASGLPHASICAQNNEPLGPSRFIHIEQRRDVRRAPPGDAATPGKNRGMVVDGILATFP